MYIIKTRKITRFETFKLLSQTLCLVRVFVYTVLIVLLVSPTTFVKFDSKNSESMFSNDPKTVEQETHAFKK